MSARWKFVTVRSDWTRRGLRRQNGNPEFTGTKSEALDFAALAQAYLIGRDIVRVEAWSYGRVEGDNQDMRRTLFKIRRHENGRDWRADETELHHGGWYLDLGFAIHYAMFRGAGRVCEIQICNRPGAIMVVVMADQRGHDAVPCVAPKLAAE